MEFWGLAIPPSKQVIGKASKTLYVHISNAALADVKIPSENERVVLRVKVKDHDFVLGTLIPGKCDQLNLDVIYNAPFIVHHNSKSCSVHLTGYTTEAMEEQEEDTSDEEDVPLPQNGALNAKAELKKKLGGKVFDSESDESDDSEDDDDDPVARLARRSELMDADEDDDDDDDDDEDDEDDDDEDDDEDDDDDDEDDEDDEDDNEEDESDEDLKVIPNESLKRKFKPASGGSPAEKKIKTPSGKAVKADVKADVKAEVKTPTVKTPKPEERKSDKKPGKNTPKSTDSKLKGTPGSKHHCEPCGRNFANESALIQHNTAKHKK